MYTDAFFDRNKDIVHIAERVNGERILHQIPAEHVLYYEHSAGSHRSIFGDSCKRFSTNSGRKFATEIAKHRAANTRLFESDIDPVFRILARDYTGADTPKLNICFFDIEADFHPTRGFAPTDDPFNAITAITFYLTSHDVLMTLALVPPTLTLTEGEAIAGEFENTWVFEDEKLLLQTFLATIEDTDVCSGWNSEGYDIPYLVNRVIRLMGKEATKAFCLWGLYPREREYSKFGRLFKTYELFGRVHLDYLILYQKHNTQQQHSYRLDFIGEIEVGENKVPYEGNLDDLYKKDFNRFLAYSRQDVMLLVKIDRKRKYIELSNQIAHANCVLLPTTVGSVRLVEQAIINEMHKLGRVVPNKKLTPKKAREEPADEDDEHTPVAGAYVATPKVGLNYEIGCVDINSLYPSTIRALNMSPETIVGQVRQDLTRALVEKRMAEGTPRAEAWEGLFTTLEVEAMHTRDPNVMLDIDYENGKTERLSAADLYLKVFAPNSNLGISANGTLFDTSKDGMIPMLLATWYAERKSLQSLAKSYATLAMGIDLDAGLADAIQLDS